jgi:ABC-type multidrug transport system ATPase subunit
MDLELRAGEVFGLLGPNGAGKTTAIRIVTGALTPDQGTVRTFGLDPDRDGEQVRRRCGVVSAKPALYDRLSAWRAARTAGLRCTRSDPPENATRSTPSSARSFFTVNPPWWN